MRIFERIKTEPDWGGAATQTVVSCGSVLVVDDEPNIRFTFRMALESSGFQVDEAPNGAAALSWLARKSCNVVLLDLRMPGLGGMEVLQRLRDEGNDVPVVIVTAHGSIPDAVAAMKLGAIDFLSKPITPDALRRVVSGVIERHVPAGPEPRPNPEHFEQPTVVTIGPPLIDLTAAKIALNRRELDRAALLLDRALDIDPHSAEALTLKGVLLEGRGQDHAAYQSYKMALTSDPNYAPARDNMQRYCERFGLDADNPLINPAAGS